MLGRLIFKSLVTISLITALFASMARAESTDSLSLTQIRDLQSSTLKALSDKEYSNEQKYDLILQQKYIAETSLRQLILDGKADPMDLTNNRSALSRAFETADVLVILAQLKLENGKFTEASCTESRGMLRISATQPGAEKLEMTRQQQNLESLIKQLCQ